MSLVPISRNISTFGALRCSLTQPLKGTTVTEHHDKAKFWKSLFLFVCIPAMGISFLNCQISEEPEVPEFKKYSHLRIRNKQYPWRDGVKTLFHNPHCNALPDGYEHH